MKKTSRSHRLTAQRLAALFLLGCVLFNYPVLSLFNHHAEILDIPVLYAWLFGVWFALIAGMAWIIEGAKD